MDDLMTTYTLEHLLALREALASGEHRVTYDGKSIEYRSVADLKAAIAEVEASIARESGASKSRQIRVTTSKAL
jgi:roadblock/LC7 domain-containing protein